MTARLSHKTALVSAAGQGIGRASALTMAAEGATVWATDVNPALLETLAGTPGIQTAVLDVTDAAAIDALVARIGRIDVLFNCAGFVANGPLLEATDAQWDFSFNLNVRSQFHMIRAVLPGMLEAGGGSIINMASVCSSIKGLPNRFIYGTTKAAVIGLTKSLGKETAKSGIRVNCVTPAAVSTPMFAQMTQAHIDFMLSKIPMNRFGEVEEIAAMVSWMATEECSFTTGAVFDLSGGRAVY